jgi:hypothetical protein
MWNACRWDDFVERISKGYNWPASTPEGVMENYHLINKRLTNLRKRLKNPVNLKGGGPLQPSSIRQFEMQEKKLIQDVYNFRKLIKCLVKYNLLPTNKLISGENGSQFVFSLWTMLELPELGKAVYYANRLMGSRYGHGSTPATNKDYAVRQSLHEGYIPRKNEERSRESMYDALIGSLSEAVQKLKTERQRLLFSGTPWQPPKNDSESNGIKTEKETNSCDVFSKVHVLLDELQEYRRCYPSPYFKKKPCENLPNKAEGEKSQPVGIISKEFLAFQREQRMKTEQHLNANVNRGPGGEELGR